MEEIARMALAFLQDLVQIDTSNPPGNELPAAQSVAKALRQEGIEPVIIESEPGRANVIARLRGDGSNGPLLLMSHLDVVPAGSGNWDQPPFSAKLVDGYIWGRGTVDTKQVTAIHMASLITLKRKNLPLKRDIILAATADEETGSDKGMGWLVENHLELIDAEYALNEGGGFGFDANGGHIFICLTGEKGVAELKFSTTGTAGRASLGQGDNALTKLCTSLARLSEATLPQHRIPSVECMIDRLAGTVSFPASLILRLVLNPRLEKSILKKMQGNAFGAIMGASLHNTVMPTLMQAGEKVHAIPTNAVAQADARLVPGQSLDDLLREIRPYLGDQVKIEVVKHVDPYDCSFTTPLFHCMEQELERADPGCTVLPMVAPGSTDGRFVAPKGIKVYGFMPTLPEPGWNPLELAHAPNERISVSNIEFGSHVFWEVIRRFCVG